MDATDLAALQAIVGKDEKDPTKSRILINTKTISAIKSALPTAQSFLEKRATYKNSAIDLMKTVS